MLRSSGPDGKIVSVRNTGRRPMLVRGGQLIFTQVLNNIGMEYVRMRSKIKKKDKFVFAPMISRIGQAIVHKQKSEIMRCKKSGSP